MKILGVFLYLLLFCPSSNAVLCVEVFSKLSSTILTASPLQRHEPLFQPAELKQHGVILVGANGPTLQSILALMSERDGSYPLIIEKSGVVVMDHQLPSTQVTGYAPFLGNHRGLFDRLKAKMNTAPKVVFAGEVKVIGGVPAFLSDSSVHFYLQADLRNRRPRFAGLELMEQNQTRLEKAFRYLRPLRLVTAQTKIYNYEKFHFDLETDGRRDGFTKALATSRFELKCRNSADCWLIYEQAQTHVRELMDRGGEQYLFENIKKFSAIDASLASHFVQQASMILRSGLMEVMASSDMMTPGTERHRLFMQFVNDAPMFLGER